MVRTAMMSATVLALWALPCVRGAAEPFALGRASVRLEPAGGGGATAAADGVEMPMRKTVPEFPPGLFSDGGEYRLNDLGGKVVVLLFYDGGDERVAAIAPQRAAVVRHFRDRPVAFFGVQAATVERCRADARRLGLPMPVFADALGVLAVRYRVTLSPAKSWRVVIIDPAGEVRQEEMLPDVIESALETARWDYRDALGEVDAKVARAVDWLESGDYCAAARHLGSMAGGTDAKAAASARRVVMDLRAAALAWKGVGDELAADSPVAAYDLYARAALFLTAPEAAKGLAESMKRLESDPRVKGELQARAMLGVLSAAVSEGAGLGRSGAVGRCEEIIEAHPGTEVAQLLVAYLDDLGVAKGGGGRSVRGGRRGGLAGGRGAR